MHARIWRARAAAIVLAWCVTACTAINSRDGLVSDAGETEGGGTLACRLFHHDCTYPLTCYVDPASTAQQGILICAAAGTQGNNASCMSTTDCEENLGCFPIADAGVSADAEGPERCAYWCIIPNSTPPFDTTGLDLSAPGSGGCPSGTRCSDFLSDFPPWLGECL